MDFPRKSIRVGCYFLLKDLLEPGIEPASPALAGGFSTTEQARKHHNFFQFSSVQLLSNSFQFSSVQSLKSCPTLCNPMNRSTSGLPVHHQLPEFTQTHVHQVSDAIQPFHPLSSPSPPAFHLSQHQSLFQ